ncbi:MAG: hypothetical protein ACF788_09935 [Novipirellula sp. JB048]
MVEMSGSVPAGFASFANRFVRSYWQTVKSGDFPMPPNEPIEETVEELIAEISFTTGVRDAPKNISVVYEVLMTSRLGDWWSFGFRHDPDGWQLIECTARSDDESKPHDLLNAAHSEYFRLFLAHVTDAANSTHSI